LILTVLGSSSHSFLSLVDGLFKSKLVFCVIQVDLLVIGVELAEPEALLLHSSDISLPPIASCFSLEEKAVSIPYESDRVIMQQNMSHDSESDLLQQEVDDLGIDLSRAFLLRPVTSAGQEHDSAQFRQSGFHGLEISEAHSAVAFSTNEEHRLFHSKFTQVRHSRSIFVLTGRRRRE
jgi:hypothetical protein